MEQDRAGRIVRTGLALLSLQSITWASTLVSLLFVPRFLGASSLGAYTTIYTAASLINLGAAFGSSNEIVKSVARERSAAASIVANAVAIRLLLWAVASLLCVAIAAVVGGALVLATSIILLGTGFGLAGGALQSGLQGNQTMGRAATLAALIGAMTQMATIAALAMGAGLIGLAIVGLVSVFAVTLGFAWLFYRAVPRSVVFSKNLCRALVRSSLPFLANEAALAVYASVDFLLLAALTNSSTVGNYSLAYKLAGVPIFASTIVMSAIYPSLAESAGRDDAWFRRVVTSGTRLVLLVTLPMAAGLMAVAPEIVHVVGGGTEFKHAVPVLILLAMFVPAASVHTILGTSLFARDRQRTVAAIAWFSAILNPLLNLAAIPIAVHLWGNGAIGAAAVMAPTELISGFLVWRAVGDDVDRRALLTAGTRALAACVLMALVARLVVGRAGLFVAVPAGALTYALLCVQFRLISIRDVIKIGTAISPRFTVAQES